MQRRAFLTSSLAASAASLLPAPASVSASASPSKSAHAQAAPSQPKAASSPREFYLLCRYFLSNGPQHKLCDDYFRDALLPALNRLRISPVGAFNLSIGPDTPSIYLLLPSPSAETLVNIESHLAQDDAYLKSAASFLNTPAASPAFDRIESSLLQAFEKMPTLTLPAATAAKSPRVFELRTYESATIQDHQRKIEMMQSGEQEIFAKAGFSQVFYGDTLVGPRMPNLTYMLSYESVADRDKKWSAFSSSPDWKAMNANPRYAFEPIVSRITNLILTPTPYSQI